MTSLWKLRVFLFVFTVIVLVTSYSLGERQGLLVGLLLALGWNGLIVWYGKRHWIDFFEASQLEGQDPWGLTESLDILAQKARVTTPKIYLSKINFPMVLTIGANPRHPSMIISEQMIKCLEHDELKAVLAVEVARLRLDDLRWMGVIGGLMAPAEAIFRIFDRGLSLFLQENSTWFRRQLRPLVQLSLRMLRGRDWTYHADRLAVQMTRDEESFIRVLKKLESYAQKRRPYLPESISPFLSVDPLTAQCGNGYFRAQPAVRDRLQSLKSHASIH